MRLALATISSNRQAMSSPGWAGAILLLRDLKDVRLGLRERLPERPLFHVR